MDLGDWGSEKGPEERRRSNRASTPTHSERVGPAIMPSAEQIDPQPHHEAKFQESTSTLVEVDIDWRRELLQREEEDWRYSVEGARQIAELVPPQDISRQADGRGMLSH